MADFRISAAEDVRALTCREDRQFQIVRADAEAFDMVVMLVCDKNGAEADGVCQLENEKE